MKKDGGIRPIAVGNIIRRLTAKCFSHALADKSSAFFQPYQMGVAVRGGLESLIHTTRQIVEEIQAQEEEGDDMMILRVDLVNAFNMVDRDEAFKEVAEHFPEMLS